MNTEQILESIDAEISRLEQAKQLLSGRATARIAKRAKAARAKSISVSVVATKQPVKRKISAEGRARIAAAQKARWAKQKKGTKT